METIGNLVRMPARSVQSTNTTLSKTYDNAPETERTEYLEEMLLIVHDSYAVSSQPVTIEEEMAKAKDWSLLLFGIIPTSRLRNAFELAFRNHQSTYPVNGYDLKNAWAAIQEADAIAAKAAEDPATKMAKCSNRSEHLIERVSADLTRDEGLVEILLGGPGGIEVQVPCPYCRETAHAQRMAELRQKHNVRETGEEIALRMVGSLAIEKARKQKDLIDALNIVSERKSTLDMDTEEFYEALDLVIAAANSWRLSQ